MFDMGFAELLLIGVLGLIVLGPERLPGVARRLGGALGQLRRLWRQAALELEKAEGHIIEPPEAANPKDKIGDETKR